MASLTLAGRKLGILVSTQPDQPGFGHALRLAAAAMDRGVDVYVYCIDDAVAGTGREECQALKARGLKLYACAYGAQQRGLPVNDTAVFAGLTVVSDIFAAMDRVLAF